VLRQRAALWHGPDLLGRERGARARRLVQLLVPRLLLLGVALQAVPTVGGKERAAAGARLARGRGGRGKARGEASAWAGPRPQQRWQRREPHEPRHDCERGRLRRVPPGVHTVRLEPPCQLRADA
jgi:hypothetical protein